MIKIKKKLLLTLIPIFLYSCQGFSDAKKIMRNEKVTSTDEFLVKKKKSISFTA